MFGINQLFPPADHKKRIKRYRENKKLFKGNAYDVFERVNNRLSKTQRDIVYISANLAGIICKKSADFLFGETPVYSAGMDDNAPEQKALERFVEDNELNITNYESALGNAYRGDSFYKIRWGQRWGGLVDKTLDPFRVIIEAQNAEYVFPETSPTDSSTIIGYHIAYPTPVADTQDMEWILHVESHYPNRIVNRKFRMKPTIHTVDNEIDEWRIYAEINDEQNGIPNTVNTGVPFPLVVHIPNYSTDDGWEGIDDLSEHKAILDEINNRLSLIAVILDKHSDPAMAVPAGSLDADENGQPQFHVGRDKVFEVMDKNEVIPQYITWNGQLEAAFKELEHLIDILLTTAEIPAVALGKGDSGTSGSSGLSIKWRMNSLLAKINRKRQYYDKGLKQVLYIAQLLEHAKSAIKPDYSVIKPRIKFKDGLPDDELEQAQIMQIRTAGAATISQKTAIMHMDDLTEEQAEKELQRIRDEEQANSFVNSSVFNKSGGDG